MQDGAAAQADRDVLARFGSRGVADRVDDRDRGEQPGDDRDDGGARRERRDEPEGEKPSDTSEAVGGTLDEPQRGGGRAEVEVGNDGSSEVGTSWPTSARKLAAPIPCTPGVSQSGSASASSA